MKNVIILTILLICFATQTICGTVKKREIQPNTENSHHQQSVIEKIKDKTGEIVHKAYEQGEIAVQKVKSGLHVAKCKLHQVGDKIYPHTHEHNPCSDENTKPDEKVISDGRFIAAEAGRAYQQKPTGRRITDETYTEVETEKIPSFDIRHGGSD